MSVRPMRGQAVVREDKNYHGRRGSIFLPDREVNHHVGEVLALGPPALLNNKPNAPEVPWDCKVGDKVLFVWIHNEKAHTREWPEDGKMAAWIPQACLLGVME